MAVIEIYNDSNEVLIDDTTLMHRLLRKTTVAATTATAMESIVNVTIPVNPASSTFPILAIAPPAGSWLTLWSTAASGGQANWRYMTTGAIGSAHECFAFQDGLSEPLAGTGMVVLWNEQGVVTFDSDADYASIVDMVFVAPDQYFTKVYPPGRKYAVSNTVPMVWRSSGGPGGSWTNVSPYGAAISGNQVTFGKYQYRGKTPGSMSGGNDVGAWFMILDVTGL
ncbi:TPA: hypothetical protein SMQ04_000172 [Pseudomonas putida]|nr:hypothetical protein [Pseudomonas putida]